MRRSLWGVGVISGQRPQNRCFCSSFPSRRSLSPQASSKRGLKPVWGWCQGPLHGSMWPFGSRGAVELRVWGAVGLWVWGRGCGSGGVGLQVWGRGCGAVGEGLRVSGERPSHPHPQCLCCKQELGCQRSVDPWELAVPGCVLTTTRMWVRPACGAWGGGHPPALVLPLG